MAFDPAFGGALDRKDPFARDALALVQHVIDRRLFNTNHFGHFSLGADDLFRFAKRSHSIRHSATIEFSIAKSIAISIGRRNREFYKLAL